MKACNVKNYDPKDFYLINTLLKFNQKKLEDYIRTTYNPTAANKILEAIKNGVFDKNWGVEKVEQIENPKDGKVLETEATFSKPNTSRSVRSYFEGNNTGGDVAYSKLIKEFKDEIISLLIFNKDSKEGVINPEGTTPSGLSLINDRLYNYKMKLAKNLLDYLGFDSSWTTNYTLSNEEFTKQLGNTIIQFELAKNLNKNGWKQVYSDYVLLKNFDKLIKEQLDFISIKKGFGDDFKGTSMYEYRGGVAPQDVNWSEDESAEIDSYTAPLIKMLLDYLPEVDYNRMDETDNDLPSPITFTGFNRVMTKLIDYINNGMGNTPKEMAIKEQLDLGVGTNWDMIINHYINVLKSSDSRYQKINERYKTILVNKLLGIKKYILGKESKLSPNIKNMFLAQINKTVDSQYIVYRKRYNATTNQYEIVSQNLHDDFISIQSRNLQRSVQTAVYKFAHNPSLFNDLLTKYGISIEKNGDEYTITLSSIDVNNSSLVDTKKSLFNSSKTINIKLKDNGKYGFILNKKENFDDAKSNETILKFIEEVLQITLPSDWESYLPIISNNATLFDVFSKPIMFTLFAAKGKINNDSSLKFKYDFQEELIETWKYQDDFSTASRYLSYVYGSDTLNVLRNSEGNNLPLYQLGSYVYDFKKLLRELKNSEVSNVGNGISNNVFEANPFWQNPNVVKRSFIRSEFDVGTKRKEARDLTFSEVMSLAMIDDYYHNLNSGDTFLLQPIVYADKRTHYLVEFNANGIPLNGDTLQNVLKRLGSKFDSKSDEQSIIDYVANYRSSKIKSQLINLINRFETALEKKYKITKESSWVDVNKVLADITKEIRGKNVKELRSKFKKSQLYEEFDIITDKSGNISGLNEVLINNGNMYWDYKNNVDTSKAKFNDRIKRERFQFAKDLYNSDFSLTTLRDKKLKRDFDKLRINNPKFDNWYDSFSQTLQSFKIYDKNTGEEVKRYTEDVFDHEKYNIEFNPIINSYYYAELALAPAYSDILFGDVAGYPSKYKREEGITDDEYYLFSEANRLTMQCKRTMAGGSTRHSYLQGLRYGVGSEVLIAEIDDPTGEAFNSLGEIKANLDLHDGGGFIHPSYSRMENVSLVDAAVNEDKKTIWTYTDKETGVLAEIKWAAYSLNNNRRRSSQEPADESAERRYRKMSSIPFSPLQSKNIDLKKFYNPEGKLDGTYDRTYTDYIYYWDQVNNINWRIDSVTNENGIAVIHETPLNSYNQESNKISPRIRKVPIKNVYSLDQIFGGAYAQKMEGSTLNWCEANVDIVTNIIAECGLRNKIVGYLVNHSALKVGSRQRNSLKDLNDPNTPLKTFTMSTKFGGVQMDASHNVQGGVVSEMSQMISSLIQAGFSTELVNEIYKDIGSVAKEGVEKLNMAIESGNEDKVNEILGKALIDSFNSTKNSGLGLTESFIVIAENEFRKNNIKVKIPFSSPDVKNAFVTTVMSQLNKSAIKRKYDGLATVLTPSAGIMMYYKWEKKNETLTYQDFVKGLYDGNDHIGQKASAIRHAYIVRARNNKTSVEAAKLEFLKDIFNKVELYAGVDDFGNEIKVLNPTIVDVDSVYTFDYYDTVVYKKKNEGWNTAKTIRLDTIANRDFIKHHLDLNEYEVRLWTAKPKDLAPGKVKIEGSFNVVDVNNNITQIPVKLDDFDTDVVRSNFYLKDLKKYISNLISGSPDNTAITKLGLNLNVIEICLRSAIPDRRTELIFNYLRNFDPLNLPTEKYTNLIMNTLDTLIAQSENRTQELYSALSNYQKGKPTDYKITVDGIELSTISKIEAKSGEAMMGRANASKLGLRNGDAISDVKAKGPRFFRDRIIQETNIPLNVDESMFDAVGYTQDGHKILLSVGSFSENIKRINKTFSSEDFRDIDGNIYYNDEKLCSSDGKIFREYITEDGKKYYFINVDSYDRIKELNKQELFTSIRLNYTKDNYKKLLAVKNPEIFNSDGTIKEGESLDLIAPDTLELNGELTLNVNNSLTLDANNISQWLSNPEVLVQILKYDEKERYFKYVENLSERKYNSFLKQLHYIAARIPTQSMQSFMSLEIVSFTDSETNDLYVPRTLTWLEGAKSKFKIKPPLSKTRIRQVTNKSNQWLLIVENENLEKFEEQIKPYILDSMSYKLVKVK